MNKMPIVIVGYNRTVMTASVIDSMLKHIADIVPYVIVVSDNSRPGHSIFLESYLKSKNVEYVVTSTTSDRKGLGSAMNIGLELAFKINDVAFIMENDWLIHRPISFEKYIDTLNNSNIGCISFKHINAYNNISCYEYTYNNKKFIIKYKGVDTSRETYPIELGCQLIHKRLFNELGGFAENAAPPVVELDYIARYSKRSIEELFNKKMLSSNDLDFLHSNLNDENSVFYHIGMNSSNNNAKWKIPQQYVYLSNDKIDEQICELFNIDTK